jgi:hypothetical protein
MVKSRIKISVKVSSASPLLWLLGDCLARLLKCVYSYHLERDYLALLSST